MMDEHNPRDPLLNDTIDEALRALEYLVELIDTLMDLRPERPEPPLAIIKADSGIADYIDLICHQFGTASTILFDDSHLHNRYQNEARQSRISFVREACEGLNISELRNRQVRNRIVHIDEYLAKIYRRPPLGPRITRVGLSRRDIFSATEGRSLIFNRVYIFDENKILHLDAELDLEKLRQESYAVVRALSGRITDNEWDSNGELRRTTRRQTRLTNRTEFAAATPWRIVSQ